SFTRGLTLIAHWHSHTGKKPFACTGCAKSFRHSSCFLQHRRVHTGERPHVCGDCGK
ncbi:ZSC29 protein, partial [Semnornis frantzii]|nr:ZSC29 protein [Semnornis frantzii]